MVSSIADNGGRSCINASAVVVPKYAAEIADALAQKLGPIAPCPPRTKTRRLSAFANPRWPTRIDAAIEEGLQNPGRGGGHRQVSERPSQSRLRGRRLSAPHHRALRFVRPPAGQPGVPLPLRQRRAGSARRTCSARSAPRWWSPPSPRTPAFRAALLESPLIDRLNLGPIPTMQVSWDQPHEGNLFEFLYRRRALELS